MSNRLIDEQSQYLLQHAHNPVDWYPWGDEAFQKAKNENKPVIVSIGYAACHWCHVMERESFEDAEVAQYMNEHFVCIKVDREEHPDVDHMYMDAVQAISGSGGWPLNAFVTPDRVPFYGGTYYPPRPAYSRPSWMQVMQRMNEIWHTQQDEVTTQADQMVNYLKQSALTISAGDKKDWNKGKCALIAEALLKQADKQDGGFGNAPKFPGSMAINFLLENYYFTGNKEALEHANHSLDAMARGGIYDQLGGGFARYSTDRVWLAPHFEKMLYDNALLIWTYAHAYSLNGNGYYKTIVEDTIAFVERELKEPTGGYYCALDADSEGVEGKFYTWQWEEWCTVLGSDAQLAADYFGVNEHGNWEHTNILHLATDVDRLAEKYGITVAILHTKINAAKTALLDVRKNRIRPLTDDKCLLSWNALMNIALTKAGKALGNEQYQLTAAAHMQWMWEKFEAADKLKHTYKDNIAKIPAMLEDYAYFIQAMLQLGSATGEVKWIARAEDMIATVIADFGYEDTFFYFTSSNRQDIPVRKIDLYDGAIPSANAVMAENLWLCGMCAENEEWIKRAENMLVSLAPSALRNGYSYGYWATLIQRNIFGLKTMIYSGKDTANLTKQLQSHFWPHVYLLFSAGNDSEISILKNKFSPDNLLIFVCSENECLPPVSSHQQAIELIDRFA